MQVSRAYTILQKQFNSVVKQRDTVIDGINVILVELKLKEKDYIRNITRLSHGEITTKKTEELVILQHLEKQNNKTITQLEKLVEEYK